MPDLVIVVGLAVVPVDWQLHDTYWVVAHLHYVLFGGSTFGRLQLVSSAFMAYSHGGNDAQKTMGIITLALVAYGAQSDFEVPVWVILIAATAMALGTAAGGWRIIKTMGTKLAKLQPVDGFAAETAAATIIEVASKLGFPLSTTQVISSSILGVGAMRPFGAVR